MLSFTDTVNPGKLLPQLDGDVSTHCLLVGPAGICVKSTGEMFGPTPRASHQMTPPPWAERQSPALRTLFIVVKVSIDKVVKVEHRPSLAVFTLGSIHFRLSPLQGGHQPVLMRKATLPLDEGPS